MWKIYYKLQDYKNEVKWAYQRVVRGYDDRVLWDIDEYLAKLLPEVIRKLRDNNNSYPFKVKSLEQWQKILSEMADGFDAYWIMNNMVFEDRKSYLKQYNILKKKHEKGMLLFVKYFGNLWD